jgi:predicted ester cyclase
MGEADKGLVRDLLEQGWASGDPGIIARYVSADVGAHFISPGLPKNRDSYVAMIGAYHEPFSDWRFAIKEQLAEGDLVATRAELTFRHTRAGFGAEPTGKEFTVNMLMMDRLADGKVVEEWVEFDRMDLMFAIGALPRQMNTS